MVTQADFDLLDENIAISRAMAHLMPGLVVVSLALFLFGKRAWVWPAYLIVLLLFHPGWGGGETPRWDFYGDHRRNASYFCTALGCLALACQVALRFGALRRALELDRTPLKMPVAEIRPRTPTESSTASAAPKDQRLRTTPSRTRHF
jgi:hypothetical protein